MKTRNTTLLTVVLLVLGLLVSACSTGGGGQTESTLDKVIKAGKVRVGFLADYAPWGSRNAQGEYEGYDVDIAHALGEALGVEVELIPVEAPNRVPAIVTDKVDVIIGSFTPTDERAKTIAFTIPYASAQSVTMAWADDDSINTYSDLAGKKVGVPRGNTNETNTAKFVPEAELVRFDTLADVYAALQTKKIDALVEDSPFVYYQVMENPQFKVAGEPFGPKGLLSFGLKRGDPDWLAYLNNFLTNLRSTGQNAELYEKWFGVPPAPLTLD